MKRNFLSLFALLLAVLMLTACNGKTIKISADDNGSTVSMKSGETLFISIDGNPTTGYTWEVDSVDQNILQLVGEAEYAQDSNLNSKKAGVGGTYKFKFTAVSAGSTTLKLKYWRTFEPDNPPIETFEVTVNVQ
jgi:inhibitor of cysteine peptidase